MTKAQNQVDETVRNFFEEKVTKYGATPQGLDYGTYERQQITFAELTKIWQPKDEPASLNDYGSGYGGIIEYLDKNSYTLTSYTGYDIAPGMIEQGQKLYGSRANCVFTIDLDAVKPADYTIAGGVFNMKLEINTQNWLKYVLDQVEMLWELSLKGLAFNILTRYSDPDRMRPDLYYADPSFFFDYCKQRFSRKVALLHDYEAYEFTVLVRR